MRAALTAFVVLYAAVAAGQPAADDDGFKGEGAALCIAAGEILSAQPRADVRLREHVSAWSQILHVMEGTDARRQTAVEEARASLASNVRMARVTWSVACGTRDSQIRYLLAHASGERMRNELAEEPGSELAAEAADRLNNSAWCMVSAEFLLQRKPADAGALRTIQDRARKEIDGAEGSAIGKALLIDYLRFLYSSANPQLVADRAKRHLSEHCVHRSRSAGDVSQPDPQ